MLFELLWLSLPPRIRTLIKEVFDPYITNPPRKSFLVHYGLHCPVFENSVGVLAMSCSECDSVLKLKIFDNTFCL